MDDNKTKESSDNLIRFDDGTDDEALIEFCEAHGIPIPKRDFTKKETKENQ